jgi:NAD-dependent DNA ligase
MAYQTPPPPLITPQFPQVTVRPTMVPQTQVTPVIPRPTGVVPIVPIVPTVPIVPKQPTITLGTIPTQIVPTVPTVPVPTVTKPITPIVTRPTFPTVPVPTVPVPTVTKPITPVVPRPTVPTVPVPTVTRPITPVVPRPTLPTQIVPTVTRPITPNVPRPTLLTQIVPTVPVPTVTRPITPVIPKPTVGTVPVPQVIGFTPDMIDEDTIVDYANKLDKVNFANLLKFLDDYYHNDESLVSDETYDELIDMYEAKYGPYTIVGAEPTGEKVQLPHYLGSLRKIKKDNELTTWLEAYPGPYIVEDKIDGLTLLLVSTTTMGRRVTSLYTRGGGYRGLDVSHLLQYMRLPHINVDIAVRGEVVLTKEAFARVGAGFKNARNLVSGIVNAKKQFNPTIARELSFYAYRIMNKAMTAEDDIKELQTMGFSVPNPVAAQTLSKDILENYFKQRKEQAPYEMDGLVIYQNKVGEYPTGEAPRHVVAFKTGTETGVTTVTNVVWRASKDRLLKPVVHYETINLSGADLQKASGYNARFIVNNNIGPGAKILITRSGDVIPKILSVITPAPGGPDIPNPAVHGKYSWNENEVEFVTTEENPEVIAGRIKHFLDTLGVKNAGRKRVEAMVAAGIKGIYTLLRVSPQQLSGIPGIGPTLSNQIYTDMHERITNVSLARIMDASGIFPHIGERRFEAILEVHPNLLDFADLDEEEIANYIRGVKGFNTLADEIAGNLPDFVEWLKQNPMITIEQPAAPTITPAILPLGKLTITPGPLTITPTPIQLQIGQPTMITQPTQVIQPTGGNKLAGITVVFSGFRDRDLEDLIRKNGGKVTGSVSRNTTFLIMKDMRPENMKGKAQEAQEKGVPLITKDDFIKRYLA